METLARLISNRATAWGVVIVTLGLAGVSVMLARQVENEDDILAFLPQHNPEVRVFSDINKRFGGLDVALVGIQATDVTQRGFLERLRKLTRELKETKGLDHVLSLANVVDFTPDPDRGGVVTSRLVEHLPSTPAEQKELRRKVMSRDHVVGNLVSADGKAVLVYCYLAYGTDPKSVAARIRDTVHGDFSGYQVFFGGGPFISTYIYNTTQRDMRRLTPWAVVAIVLIMVLSFRDFIGSFLALLSTAIGIVLSVGLMGFFGVKYNIVLGSMPVILFAIGSAYGIHVLARYYTLTQQTEPDDPDPAGSCAARTVISVGPTVLTAGLTTAAGLLSFIMMDIQPIRTFGLFTALGILFTLILSLTFIPAVARLVGLKRGQSGSLALRKLMVRFTVFAAEHRLGVGLALGAVSLLGLVWAARVDSRMDLATFFAKGSPPDRAERFLRDHFGGSLFIQLHVKGDMNDAEVLRELQRLADRMALLPHVSSVLHVGQAVAQVNEVMVGQRRLPDTGEQVRLLYVFLAGDPSVAQLVTADRKHALMHIKVSSNLAADLEPLLDRLEQIAEQQGVKRYVVQQVKSSARARARGLELISLRVQALAHNLLPGALTGEQQKKLERALTRPRPPVSADQVVPAVARFLRSAECAVQLPAVVEGMPLLHPARRRHIPERPAMGARTGAPPRRGARTGIPDPAQAVARALADLGPLPREAAIQRAVAAALGRAESDDLVQDLAMSVATPLQEFWRGKRAELTARQALKAAGVTVPRSGKGERFLAGTATAMLDLDLQRALVSSGKQSGRGVGTLGYEVNGQPVMHRGLSRSVQRNQLKSLGFALTLIVLIMALIFRSLATGLLVAAPTLFTLVVVYGGMGLLGVRLDIGTSMLASLILGAGVDYAVHLTATWYAPAGASLVSAAARAADRSGPAIWTNAIMVCAGFLVLATGEARPLQNVGGLTGAAMITAAVATFLLVPVLARRRVYSRSAETLDGSTDSEVVEAVLRKSES